MVTASMRVGAHMDILICRSEYVLGSLFDLLSLPPIPDNTTTRPISPVTEKTS